MNRVLLTEMKGGRTVAKSEGNCAVLGYCAASDGDCVPTFGDNLTVPSSWLLKMGPIGCPQMSVRRYHYSLRNDPEEHSCNLPRGGNLKSSKLC